MTPEKRVQNKIIDFLKERSKTDPLLIYERRQAGGFNYHKGAPDIWFAYNGHHCEVEVKAPNGEPSPLQINFSKSLQMSGCSYCLVDSFDAFKNFFEAQINKI